MRQTIACCFALAFHKLHTCASAASVPAGRFLPAGAQGARARAALLQPGCNKQASARRFCFAGCIHAAAGIRSPPARQCRSAIPRRPPARPSEGLATAQAAGGCRAAAARCRSPAPAGAYAARSATARAARCLGARCCGTRRFGAGRRPTPPPSAGLGMQGFDALRQRRSRKGRAAAAAAAAARLRAPALAGCRLHQAMVEAEPPPEALLLAGGGCGCSAACTSGGRLSSSPGAQLNSGGSGLPARAQKVRIGRRAGIVPCATLDEPLGY